MNKTLKILSFPIIALLISSCNKEDFERNAASEKDFNKFKTALELTSALVNYSINISKTENGITIEEKKVLSTNSDNEYVAYRKIGETESYWYDGLSYEIEGNSKVKIAKSLKTFLGINEIDLDFSFDAVKSSLKRDNKTYSFDLSKEDYDKVSFKCELGSYFINKIDANFIKNSSIQKTVSYVYENPGVNPTVTLPSDLNSYVY